MKEVVVVVVVLDPYVQPHGKKLRVLAISQDPIYRNQMVDLAANELWDRCEQGAAEIAEAARVQEDVA